MATTRELTKSRLIDHIGRVELRVQDIAGSLSFYRGVVGLQVAEQDENEATLRAPDGPVILRLLAAGVTRPADPRATGLFHVAIRFPTRASLGDALARLVDAGYEVGAGDHLVSEALYIDDPDGNGVELYWDRPIEQWPAPANGMIVPMATLPVDLQGLLAESHGRGAVNEPAATGTDIGHAHLQVSDIDRTAEFYADAIGLDMIARLGNQARFLSSNGYHHHIGANVWRSWNGKPAERERAGLERVVFVVSDPAELNALRTRLAASGAQAEGDERTIVVHDPDGIELHFELRRRSEERAEASRST